MAERLVPYIRVLHAEHPGLNTPPLDEPYSAHAIRRSIDKALRALYNPAQRDVIRRTWHLLRTPQQHGQV